MIGFLFGRAGSQFTALVGLGLMASLEPLLEAQQAEQNIAQPRRIFRRFGFSEFISAMCIGDSDKATYFNSERGDKPPPKQHGIEYIHEHPRLLTVTS
jgi:hypothetical protein